MKYGEQILRGWVREDIEASSEEYFKQRFPVKNTQKFPVKNTQNEDSSEEHCKQRLQRRILQRLQLSGACLIPESAHRFCDQQVI